MTDSQIRVLIVDDSALFRHALRDVLSHVPDVTVVGSAKDGDAALAKVVDLDPDLLTLDVEMPGKSGIDVLKEMKRRGCRSKAIMVSRLTARGAASTTDALLAGAFDFILKPADRDRMNNRRSLLQAVTEKIAAFQSWRLSQVEVADREQKPPGSPVKALSSVDRSPQRSSRQTEAILIGTSTGGPDALRQLLPQFAVDLPIPVVVVQHMPGAYTLSLAQRLDSLCELPVSEAQEGDRLKAGEVLIAQGGQHLGLARRGDGLSVRITDDPPEHGCRPAMDYLLRSAADISLESAVIAILTGMGQDGTEGCRKLKQSGCTVLAQDQATSTVFGMPKSIIDNSLADVVVPLERMADAIVQSVTLVNDRS